MLTNSARQEHRGERVGGDARSQRVRESVCESVYAREFMCDGKGCRRRRVKRKGGRVAFMDVKNAHVCTPCLIKQALNLGGQTPGEKLQFYTIKTVLC